MRFRFEIPVLPDPTRLPATVAAVAALLAIYPDASAAGERTVYAVRTGDVPTPAASGASIGPDAHRQSTVNARRADADARTGRVTSAEAVYAAFTLNLTRFITWPEAAFGSATAPFVIGSFPGDRINAELDAVVRGEIVHGRPVQTLRVRTLDDLARCHAVFVSREVADVQAVLARLDQRPVLTISDAEGFLKLGGHVRFMPQEGGARLQVSAVNLRASGLEASAQLLRLAAEP